MNYGILQVEATKILNLEALTPGQLKILEEDNYTFGLLNITHTFYSFTAVGHSLLSGCEDPTPLAEVLNTGELFKDPDTIAKLQVWSQVYLEQAPVVNTIKSISYLTLWSYEYKEELKDYEFKLVGELDLTKLPVALKNPTT